MSKISVIGAGSVGATVANDLMVQGIASEIVLVDINEKKARGEALDVYQGAPFQSPAIVRPGTYADTAGSDIVIITCGVPRKPGMTRLDLAQTNVNILCSIAPQITKYAPNATYVIVSNPVDILTYVWHKTSGLPANKIHCSVLAEEAVKAAVADYYKKNGLEIDFDVNGCDGCCANCDKH